ncbi:MAG TPA: M23 family metallopeptidase [Anaerolineae bacterium]|nr:M23 family metallopeptidase [Anaerolineae bacterium]
MDYQIILLPRHDYWSWVRASAAYVMAYGPNLTPDPVTAAQYLAPRQVITFPVIAGGFPEQGEIERWFLAHYPGIRLDPIEVTSPEELQRVLNTRVEEKDRYGLKERPFYLIWPTDYAVITQEFRANPHIYGRWGFPGHEGVDFRARTNTNIYCCADGEVYRLHTNPKSHPYGIHVRLRHEFGYKTVYAHLREAFIKEGEIVQAGQVIGLADSTGASVGSHLHLTLKRDGATDREETDFPKDILDPTPFLVWPEFVTAKSIEAYPWSAGRCLIGAHGRVGGPLEEDDIEAIKEARLEAVKLDQTETTETVKRLLEINPGMFLAVRMTSDFSSAPISAKSFVAEVEPEMGRFYGLGIRYFEIHTNPNLQSEGWERSWSGGKEFSRWFRDVVGQLKAVFPAACFGFPGLSHGESVSGWREDGERFLLDAEDAVVEADWVGVNCYWTDFTGMKSVWGGKLYETYRLRYPNKLLFITEFCNPSAQVGQMIKGQQYLDFYRMLRDTPGIGAVFSYALSAVEGHDSIVWRSKNGDQCRISSIISDRNF